jgi:TonB-linked SusC/RagA family outer membrane protein
MKIFTRSVLISKHTTQIIRTMKISVFLLLVSIFPVIASNAYSQDVEISFKQKSLTLETVIQKIEASTNYRFLYRTEQFDMQQIVNVSVLKAPVLKILNDLSRSNDFNFKVLDHNLIVLSQNKVVEKFKVTGTVVSATSSETLIGVSIKEKGHSTTAITDVNGAFTIMVASPNAVLEFSYMGYEKQTVEVNNASQLTIRLVESVQKLDEVIVVGYGSQKKSDITGAVGSVAKDRIENSVSTDAIQLLQGSVAGLNVTATEAGSDPSSGGVMLIRGRNSISASTAPLIVLDGIPYNGSLSDINTFDIESIEVLKDASSTAIYGSRASNGVILIQTKKGTKGKLTIRYNAFYFVQSVANFPDLMNGEEYYQFKKGVIGTGTTEDPAITDAEIAVYNSGSYKSFTWKDLILRDGTSQQHNLSVSGGSDNTTYTVSLSYLGTNGIVVNDKYKRVNTRINVTSNITKWLTLGSNSMLGYIDNGGAKPSFIDLFNKSPLAVPFNADGSINIMPIADDPAKLNPLENLLYADVNKKYSVSSDNYLNIDFPFAKGLSFRLNTGVQYRASERDFYQGLNTGRSRAIAGQSQTNTGNGYSYTIENIVSYQRTFGKNTVFLTGLYSTEEKLNENKILDAQGFPNDFLSYFGSSQASMVTPSFEYAKTDLISQMFRANYSYDSRYLFTATVRRDGYSGFGINKKYGVFPSVAIGWNIANEKFFSKAKRIFNTLKLRGSYGLSGNQAINPYQTISQLGGSDYIDGSTPAPGYVPETLGTPALGWESTRALNLGLDFSILNSRISGEINVYNNNTQDLLLKRAISAINGVSYVYENIGKTHNKGIEFMINTNNINNKNFSWSSNLNFAVIQTEIKDLYGDGKDDIANKWFIGQNIRTNYDYKIIGTWQVSDSVLAATYGALPGYARYDDKNKNGVYDPGDRQIIGSPEPNFTWGITNTFRYKNFGLSVFVYGKNGVTKLNPYKDRAYLINRVFWTSDNPINSFWSNVSNANKYLGKGNYPSVYENADFARIKDITLTYTLPRTLLSKVKIKNVKIYFTGKILFTLTKYTGLDPELDNQRAVPLQREFIFGLDLSL